ncbi:MAG TPA: FkbM family methyltransferase, partial [Longimicrobiaceae bacterium]|nr:FkbM family methyltransferase [Longimicrobiaceae bacterium]
RLVRQMGVDVVAYPRWNTTPWALKTLLPQLGVDCVLDVGGHFGEFGALLREIGYRGEIVSFEPLPESFARLRERCAADPKWRALPIAVGAEEGELPINVTAGTEFASFLVPDAGAWEEYRDAMRVERTEVVPVRRLDAVLDEVLAGADGRRLFLKSDTQGYDLHVMEGAGERIRDMLGVQAELPVKPLYHGMPGLAEALSYLEGKGFELFGLYPVNHDGDGRVIEFDCVMRRG